MILEIGKNQGHIIIDDNTGRILSVCVRNAIKGKSDFITISSYSNKDKKHYTI